MPVAVASDDDATIDKAQRRALGKTLRQLANLVAGVLVLGQFVGQQPVSFILTTAGAIMWLAFVAVGLWLAGES